MKFSSDQFFLVKSSSGYTQATITTSLVLTNKDLYACLARLRTKLPLGLHPSVTGPRYIDSSRDILKSVLEILSFVLMSSAARSINTFEFQFHF